jgi:hypothetical protein
MLAIDGAVDIRQCANSFGGPALDIEDPMTRAATTLHLAVFAASLSTSATGVDAARALACLGPDVLFDGPILLLQALAAGFLGAGFGLEVRRQRRTPPSDARIDSLMTLSLLGCGALALAAFLISLRLGPCQLG